jgi:hypothetical protein
MRYQLRGSGWLIGQWYIPQGTIIDTTASDDWSKLAVGLIPPINGQPLDQATYDFMKSQYGPQFRDGYVSREDYVHWIVTADGIVR